MSHITIVAPQELWNTIYQRIRSKLDGDACTSINSRERHKGEPEAVRIITDGLTPENETILRNTLDGYFIIEHMKVEQ